MLSDPSSENDVRFLFLPIFL